MAATLTADALRVVVSFIPLRPRLLVAARVCKAWHRAVISTVEVITESENQSPAQDAALFSALPRFTALRHLEILGTIPAGAILPVSLRHVSLRASYDSVDDPAGITALLDLPRLTSLEFWCWNKTAMAEMLDRYATALETLTFRAEVPISLVANLRFPALRSLRIALTKLSTGADVAAFLTQIQSQLTSLCVQLSRSISRPFHFPPDAHFSFPELTDLVLVDFAEEDAAPLIAGCGPATTLEVQQRTAGTLATMPWLSRVTRLSLEKYAEPFPFELAPKLVSVSLEIERDGLAMVSELHRCSALEVLTISPFAVQDLRFSQFAACPRLEDLSIFGDRLVFDIAAPLPALREFACMETKGLYPGSESFETLLAALCYLPHLSSLYVHSTTPPPAPPSADLVITSIDRIIKLAPHLTKLLVIGPGLPQVSPRRWHWCDVRVISH